MSLKSLERSTQLVRNAFFAGFFGPKQLEQYSNQSNQQYNWTPLSISDLANIKKYIIRNDDIKSVIQTINDTVFSERLFFLHRRKRLRQDYGNQLEIAWERFGKTMITELCLVGLVIVTICSDDYLLGIPQVIRHDTPGITIELRLDPLTKKLIWRVMDNGTQRLDVYVRVLYEPNPDGTLTSPPMSVLSKIISVDENETRYAGVADNMAQPGIVVQQQSGAISRQRLAAERKALAQGVFNRQQSQTISPTFGAAQSSATGGTGAAATVNSSSLTDQLALASADISSDMDMGSMASLFEDSPDVMIDIINSSRNWTSGDELKAAMKKALQTGMKSVTVESVLGSIKAKCFKIRPGLEYRHIPHGSIPPHFMEIKENLKDSIANVFGVAREFQGDPGNRQRYASDNKILEARFRTAILKYASEFQSTGSSLLLRIYGESVAVMESMKRLLSNMDGSDLDDQSSKRKMVRLRRKTKKDDESSSSSSDDDDGGASSSSSSSDTDDESGPYDDFQDRQEDNVRELYDAFRREREGDGERVFVSKKSSIETDESIPVILPPEPDILLTDTDLAKRRSRGSRVMPGHERVQEFISQVWCCDPRYADGEMDQIVASSDEALDNSVGLVMVLGWMARNTSYQHGLSMSFDGRFVGGGNAAGSGDIIQSIIGRKGETKRSGLERRMGQQELAQLSNALLTSNLTKQQSQLLMAVIVKQLSYSAAKRDEDDTTQSVNDDLESESASTDKTTVEERREEFAIKEKVGGGGRKKKSGKNASTVGSILGELDAIVEKGKSTEQTDGENSMLALDAIKLRGVLSRLQNALHVRGVGNTTATATAATGAGPTIATTQTAAAAATAASSADADEEEPPKRKSPAKKRRKRAKAGTVSSTEGGGNGDTETSGTTTEPTKSTKKRKRSSAKVKPKKKKKPPPPSTETAQETEEPASEWAIGGE